MPNELRFDGRVAIITGAGNGLGRSHALLLASRGARVVVNDLGGSAHGEGKSSAAADAVVAQITAAGGEAVANYDSVEDGDKIVQAALDHFGTLDIVVNNAGILRDTSFAKMTAQDWDLIYRVHVLGAFRVTHAAWPHLRDKGYGRIVFTSSAAGIYGNFGQANYAMAKLGLVGLANTLALEGKKRNVRANAIAPIAGSRMTETVLPPELLDALRPEFVSPVVAYLCHESCEESGGLFEVGGGFVGKLRWERAAGALFKLSRPMALEAVAAQWGAVTDFAGATHPESITASMEPILANLGSAKGRGGNEFIDVDAALGYQFPEATSSYAERDLALYALGVGAAANALDPKELPFVYELHRDGFRALPTFAVIPALNSIFGNVTSVPGLSFGLDRILHGEQYTEVTRPLPTKATLTHRTRVRDIFDKGKNAVIVFETTSVDSAGDVLIRNELSMVVRGAGGWGGERGPAGESSAAPDRAPDAVVEEKTSDNQALLYRLSGDWNPLHADPDFAGAVGFKRPILHGLCTFGYAGRHVVRAMCDGDPGRFKSIKVRFADSVYPGETLRTEMWKVSDTRVVFRCKAVERDVVVLSAAAVELYTAVPSEKPAAASSKKSEAPTAAPAAPAPAAPTAPASTGGPTTADVFWGIRHYVATHPELVAKVGTVFQFKLTAPDTVWTLDAKHGKGAVTEGAGEKPDVTLELSDGDFLGMAGGKLDAQKLYFAGKLKISGNVMASQKLSFLTKIDPNETAAAMAAAGYRLGGGSAPASPATAASAPATAAPAANASASARAPEIFAAIRDRLAKNPRLATEVGAVLQFRVTAPDSAWVVDLASSPAVVREGTDPKATTKLELSEDDLVAFAQGGHSLKELFQHGKLRVDGDMRPVHQLQVLRQPA